MSLWSGHKHGSSSYRQLQKQRLRCIERLQGEAVKLREQQAFSDSLSLVDEKNDEIEQKLWNMYWLSVLRLIYKCCFLKFEFWYMCLLGVGEVKEKRERCLLVFWLACLPLKRVC